MSADKVTQLVNMGFERSQAVQALVTCNDQLELAILHLCGDIAPQSATPTTTTSNMKQDTVEISNPDDIPDLSQYTHGIQETGVITSYQVHKADADADADVDSGADSGADNNDTDNIIKSAPPQDAFEVLDSDFNEISRSQLQTPGDVGSRYPYDNVHQNQTPEPSVFDDPHKLLPKEDEAVSPVVLANGKFLEGYVAPLFTILGQLNVFDKAIFDLLLPEHLLVYDPEWFRKKSTIVKTEALNPNLRDSKTVEYLILLQLLLSYLRSGDSKRPFVAGNFLSENIPLELRQNLINIDDALDLLLSFYRHLDESYQAVSNNSASLSHLFQSEIQGPQDPVKLLSISLDSEVLGESGSIQQWLNKVFLTEEQTHSFSYVSPILSFSISRDGDDSFIPEDTQIDEYLYPHLYATKYIEIIDKMKQRREDMARERQSQNQELLELTSFEGFNVSKLIARAIDSMDDEDARNDLIQIQDALRQEKSTLSHQLMTGSNKYASLDIQDFDNVMAYLKHNNIEQPPKFILTGIIISPVEYYVRETHSSDSWKYVRELQTAKGTLRDYIHEAGLHFESIQQSIGENMARYLMESPLLLIYVEESIFFEENEFTVPEKMKNFINEDNEYLAQQRKTLEKGNDKEVVEISDDDEDDVDDHGSDTVLLKVVKKLSETTKEE